MDLGNRILHQDALTMYITRFSYISYLLSKMASMPISVPLSKCFSYAKTVCAACTCSMEAPGGDVLESSGSG